MIFNRIKGKQITLRLRAKHTTTFLSVGSESLTPREFSLLDLAESNKLLMN